MTISLAVLLAGIALFYIGSGKREADTPNNKYMIMGAILVGSVVFSIPVYVLLAIPVVFVIAKYRRR